MQKLQMPLKVKLSLLITTLLVLTVVVVSILLLRQQQQALTAEMIKRGFTIADNLAAGGKSALVANDDLTLNVLVKQAMLDGDIAYVIFADEDGVVRAHSDVGAIGRPLMRPSGLEPLGDQPQVR